MQIFSLITKGGYVMYPIILCSIISLAIFLERWYVLRHSRERVDRYLRSVKRAVAQRDWESVVDISKKNQSPPSRIILAGVRKYFQGLTGEAREAMEDVAMQELPVYEKRLSTLSVVASISPLLGLLGTVTGMIRTFDVISVVGVGKPAEMAGGISEALITTAAGLIVAIPTVLAHHYLSNLADKI
ncbi:MAG: MotA/TolQ/ExbB proton channel family protein, partial [Atribacterales bacterium]